MFVHYFYIYWSDEKQFLQLDRFVEFVHETRKPFLNRQLTSTLGSLIVHCSCGLDKSGIYALVCSVLDEVTNVNGAISFIWLYLA